jgi:hypothetical protein
MLVPACCSGWCVVVDACVTLNTLWARPSLAAHVLKLYQIGVCCLLVGRVQSASSLVDFYCCCALYLYCLLVVSASIHAKSHAFLVASCIQYAQGLLVVIQRNHRCSECRLLLFDAALFPEHLQCRLPHTGFCSRSVVLAGAWGGLGLASGCRQCASGSSQSVVVHQPNNCSSSDRLCGVQSALLSSPILVSAYVFNKVRVCCGARGCTLTCMYHC